MRFNSPPNWPAPPPGWTPPPDWRPDPSWPPPPPGWQLWVPDAPSGSKKGLIIGGIAAALVILIGAVVAIVVFTGGSSDVKATPTTTTSEKKSDEDQIKDVIEKFETAWNDSNFDAFGPIVCNKSKTQAEFNERDFLEAREGSAELHLTVSDVTVDGDDATATVKNKGTDPDDITLVRESGEWKWCDF